MFSPLPLRLCCMAAMAPALTDAASQSCSCKLIASPPDPAATERDPSPPILAAGKTTGSTTSTPSPGCNGLILKGGGGGGSIANRSAADQLRKLKEEAISLNNKPPAKSQLMNGGDRQKTNNSDRAPLPNTTANNSHNSHSPQPPNSSGSPCDGDHVADNINGLPAVTADPSDSTLCVDGEGEQPESRDPPQKSSSNVGDPPPVTAATTPTTVTDRGTGGDCRSQPIHHNSTLLTSELSGSSGSRTNVNAAVSISSSSNNNNNNGGSSSDHNSSSSSTDDTTKNSAEQDPVSNHNNNNAYCRPEGTEKSETATVAAVARATVRAQDVSEVSKKSVRLERKAEYLLRRIRRLQCRQSQQHVGSQLAGFGDKQKCTLQLLAKLLESGDDLHQDPPAAGTPTPAATTTEGKAGGSAAPDRCKVPSELSALLHKLDAGQRQALLMQLKGRGATGQGVLMVLNSGKKASGSIRSTTGLLQANLAHLEAAIDTDATESSSGGESSDEVEEALSAKEPQPPAATATTSTQVPLYKRALWKWAVDRAAVASRWTWLQAQVSDLEYRIRQQSEIYRQIRAAKGTVCLADQSPPHDLMKLATTAPTTTATTTPKLTPAESRLEKLKSRSDLSPANVAALMSNVDQQSAKLSQSLGNCYSPVVAPGPAPSAPKDSTVASPRSSLNGFVDTTTPRKPAQGQGAEAVPCSPPDSSCQAARTRPVRMHRKRKLLRTAGLHTLNRKAAKLSTVRCNCLPPMTPCIMCSGRHCNVKAVDSYTMPQEEVISLLDYSYHPVLSFKEDIPLSVHFESLLKSGRWQNRTVGKPALKRKQSQQRGEKKAGEKSLKRNSARALITARMHRKEKMLKRSKGGHSSVPITPTSAAPNSSRLCKTSSIKKRKAATQMALAALKNRSRSLSLPSLGTTPSGTPTNIHQGVAGRRLARGAMRGDTPPGGSSLSASLPSSAISAIKAQRRGESAFDINNIVIPYSMAASTRVEKLNYKEIVTPSWRPADTQPGPEPPGPEEVEDVGEEAVAQRHMRSEQLEKQRYLGYLGPFHAHGRRGSRHDSLSQNSSTCGTPEPWSPLSPGASLSEGSITPRDPLTPRGTESLPPLGSPSPLSSAHPLPPPLDLAASHSSSVSVSVVRQSSYEKRLQLSGAASGLSDRSTPDPYQEEEPEDWLVAVAPWEAREFPLEDDPENQPTRPSTPDPQVKPVLLADGGGGSISGDGVGMEGAEPAAKMEGVMVALNKVDPVVVPPGALPEPYLSDEEGGAQSGDEDDPNDPEWTVVKPERLKVVKPDPSGHIVLKLAKR